MIPVITDRYDGSTYINPLALAELKENNCTMPDVERVIFNLKTKETKAKRDTDGKLVIDEKTGKPIRETLTLENPVLATTVYFVDETKISVKNSVHDHVDIEQKTLEDGTVVTVASKEAKERGIVYAIIKRMNSIPDADGHMVDSGLGRKLTELVDGAYDTELEAANNKIAKAKSKAAHDKKIGTGHKRQKYSIKETLAKFNEVLDKVNNGTIKLG